MIALEAYSRTRVPRELAHLVRLRASVLNGCRYCLAMHRRDARKDGWGPERIAAAERGEARWDGSEERENDTARVVLAVTEAVTHVDGEDSVPDELWDALVAVRGDTGAGHVLMEIVTINAWNRIAIATRLDPAGLRGVRAEEIPG